MPIPSSPLNPGLFAYLLPKSLLLLTVIEHIAQMDNCLDGLFSSKVEKAIFSRRRRAFLNLLRKCAEIRFDIVKFCFHLRILRWGEGHICS